MRFRIPAEICGTDMLERLEDGRLLALQSLSYRLSFQSGHLNKSVIITYRSNALPTMQFQM